MYFRSVPTWKKHPDILPGLVCSRLVNLLYHFAGGMQGILGAWFILFWSCPLKVPHALKAISVAYRQCSDG